ncbi:hypothetical protein EWI61_13760 [Methylolobus aquaticus]|nr:hypothetical protein EWI61_13760 [Methylolobus aquaticus]
MPALSAAEGTAVDLRFSQAPGITDLVFGSDQGGEVIPLDATLVVMLPPLVFAAAAIPDAPVAMMIALSAFSVAAEGRYDSRAARPTVGQAQSRWHRGAEHTLGFVDRCEATTHDRSVIPDSWQLGARCLAGVEERVPGRLLRSRQALNSAFEAALRADGDPRQHRYGDALRQRTGGVFAFDNAERRAGQRQSLPHQDGLRDGRRAVRARYAEALNHPGARFFERIRTGQFLMRGWVVGYQNAIVPPPGRHSDDSVIPPEPELCYRPSTLLRFSLLALSRGDLLFLCERGGVPALPRIVPIRRVYCVRHDVTLHRLPDGAEVPAFSLALSLEASSWTWGFEALLPATALPLVEPDSSGPVELLAEIDGTEFRVLAESLSRERSFGEASIRVTGRGRNAVLAAPYAPVMTFSNTEARTARQLLDDMLTHDGTATGVPLGWSIEFGLTDWLVPAGVFSHQGTRMEALRAIAEATGGYVQPHRSEMTLGIRHRYPVAPWEWDTLTPDLVLPADVVVRESLRWEEKPAYNRVFVSGQSVGMLGQITRAGTAGEVLAPMVVDPLITEAAAARQRGLAILADTGRQIEVTLRLPVLNETGIIEPGAFVAYQDGSVTRLGLVRSTVVQASLPDVWQTLGVETHG